MPVYFYPALFVSRMPVEIKQNTIFKDDTGKTFFKTVRDGITYTIPENPVSIMQNVNWCKSKMYNRFLIDFSFSSPSKNRFNTIINKFKQSAQIQPSGSFNFTGILK